MSIRTKDDPVLDPQRLRERLDKAEKRLTAIERADLVVDGGRLLKLRAPNGTYYSLEVSNAGALVLTARGTTL